MSFSGPWYEREGPNSEYIRKDVKKKFMNTFKINSQSKAFAFYFCYVLLFDCSLACSFARSFVCMYVFVFRLFVCSRVCSFVC